jgi:hypothetical protein
MKKSNAKPATVPATTAGEIIQQAVAGNLAFKETHGISDYKLAREIGGFNNMKMLLKSTKPETVDRITAGLIKITGIQFDPFLPVNELPVFDDKAPGERTHAETFKPIPLKQDNSET